MEATLITLSYIVLLGVILGIFISKKIDERAAAEREKQAFVKEWNDIEIKQATSMAVALMTAPMMSMINTQHEKIKQLIAEKHELQKENYRLREDAALQKRTSS